MYKRCRFGFSILHSRKDSDIDPELLRLTVREQAHTTRVPLWCKHVQQESGSNRRPGCQLADNVCTAKFDQFKSIYYY